MTHCLIPPFVPKFMDESGTFAGYASVFDVMDSDGDVMTQKAFAPLDPDNPPKMLWQHDMQQPIGKWEVLQVDKKGLWVEGRLFLEVQKAREAYTLLKEGVLDGLSIGFFANKTVPRAEGGRYILAAEVVEISLVTFPANPEARITHVKHNRPYQPVPEIAAIERWPFPNAKWERAHAGDAPQKKSPGYGLEELKDAVQRLGDLYGLDEGDALEGADAAGWGSGEGYAFSDDTAQEHPDAPFSYAFL